MAGEEELKEELEKLEIGILKSKKTTKKRNSNLISSEENPFFHQITADSSSSAANNNDEINFGSLSSSSHTKIKCKCRIRQNSESIIIEECIKPRPSSPHHNQQTQSSSSDEFVRTILHQRSFKPKRRQLLREPILKSIQKCTHHHSVNSKKSLRRSCPANVESSVIEALNLASSSRINKSGCGGGGSSSSYKESSDKNLLSFQDLLEQCKTISDDGSNGVSQQLTNSNLNIIQSTEKRSPVSRNCPSCSQQARISQHNSMDHTTSGTVNGSPGDDENLNIDELASYFETFVHIPKKMSSMAEMMYI